MKEHFSDKNYRQKSHSSTLNAINKVSLAHANKSKEWDDEWERWKNAISAGTFYQENTPSFLIEMI